MLTMEKLISYGADTETGLQRCMNNEAFYLQLIGMILKEPNFDKLEAAVAAHDLKTAFEAAHALKGVTGNLALTPLYEPIVEITELLRAGTETDYSGLLQTIRAQKDKLQDLSED